MLAVAAFRWRDYAWVFIIFFPYACKFTYLPISLQWALLKNLFWLMVQSSNSIRRYAVNLALHFSVTQSLSEVSVIYFCIFHLEDVCCILYFLNTHYALFLLFAFHSISGRLSLLCTSESFLILSQVHSQSLWMDIQGASSNSTEVINLI